MPTHSAAPTLRFTLAHVDALCNTVELIEECYTIREQRGAPAKGGASGLTNKSLTHHLSTNLRNCGVILGGSSSPQRGVLSQTARPSGKVPDLRVIRALIEALIWADAHDESIFHHAIQRGVMETLERIVTNAQVQPAAKVQVLHSLTILLRNVNNAASLHLLYSHNHLNRVIAAEMDDDDDEVASMFVSFLRTIALRLETNTLPYLLFTTAASTAASLLHGTNASPLPASPPGVDDARSRQAHHLPKRSKNVFLYSNAQRDDRMQDESRTCHTVNSSANDERSRVALSDIDGVNGTDAPVVFPLFDRAVKLMRSADAIVRTAARQIVITLIRLDDDRVRQFVRTRRSADGNGHAAGEVFDIALCTLCDMLAKLDDCAREAVTTLPNDTTSSHLSESSLCVAASTHSPLPVPSSAPKRPMAVLRGEFATHWRTHTRRVDIALEDLVDELLYVNDLCCAARRCGGDVFDEAVIQICNKLLKPLRHALYSSSDRERGTGESTTTSANAHCDDGTSSEHTIHDANTFHGARRCGRVCSDSVSIHIKSVLSRVSVHSIVAFLHLWARVGDCDELRDSMMTILFGLGISNAGACHCKCLCGSAAIHGTDTLAVEHNDSADRTDGGNDNNTDEEEEEVNSSKACSVFGPHEEATMFKSTPAHTQTIHSDVAAPAAVHKEEEGACFMSSTAPCASCWCTDWTSLIPDNVRCGVVSLWISLYSSHIASCSETSDTVASHSSADTTRGWCTPQALLQEWQRRFAHSEPARHNTSTTTTTDPAPCRVALPHTASAETPLHHAHVCAGHGMRNDASAPSRLSALVAYHTAVLVRAFIGVTTPPSAVAYTSSPSWSGCTLMDLYDILRELCAASELPTTTAGLAHGMDSNTSRSHPSESPSLSSSASQVCACDCNRRVCSFDSPMPVCDSDATLLPRIDGMANDERSPRRCALMEALQRHCAHVWRLVGGGCDTHPYDVTHAGDDSTRECVDAMSVRASEGAREGVAKTCTDTNCRNHSHCDLEADEEEEERVSTDATLWALVQAHWRTFCHMHSILSRQRATRACTPERTAAVRHRLLESMSGREGVRAALYANAVPLYARRPANEGEVLCVSQLACLMIWCFLVSLDETNAGVRARADREAERTVHGIETRVQVDDVHRVCASVLDPHATADIAASARCRACCSTRTFVVAADMLRNWVEHPERTQSSADAMTVAGPAVAKVRVIETSECSRRRVRGCVVAVVVTPYDTRARTGRSRWMRHGGTHTSDGDSHPAHGKVVDGQEREAEGEEALGGALGMDSTPTHRSTIDGCAVGSEVMLWYDDTTLYIVSCADRATDDTSPKADTKAGSVWACFDLAGTSALLSSQHIFLHGGPTGGTLTVVYDGAVTGQRVMMHVALAVGETGRGAVWRRLHARRFVRALTRATQRHRRACALLYRTLVVPQEG